MEVVANRDNSLRCLLEECKLRISNTTLEAHLAKVDWMGEVGEDIEEEGLSLSRLSVFHSIVLHLVPGKLPCKVGGAWRWEFKFK